jgi:ribosomal subunit interface protein
MITNIKATGLELTPAISNFLADKLTQLEKKLGAYASESQVQAEVAKTTAHHKAGKIFRAEINLLYRGKNFRSVIDSDDLYLAIDGSKDKIIQDVNKFEKRQNSLFRRGGRAIKDLLRGWRR